MENYLRSNRELGTIQNNDIGNILFSSFPGDMTPGDYREAVEHLLEGKPSVLAQTVGQPDPVIYNTKAATTFDRYLVEVQMKTFEDIWSKIEGADPVTTRKHAAEQAEYLKQIFSCDTSPLDITIKACHEQGVPVFASYRMNGEDWYHNSYLLYDFGRHHPEWRIPLTNDEKQKIKEKNAQLPEEKRWDEDNEFTGALDYAVPEVFEYRMNIFHEVAYEYDIDGIEFDFRRWTHMISNPLENYPVFTELVKQTRRMLDKTARDKDRERMLLCVRVGPSLDDPLGTEYPGGTVENDFSSRYLGLDVAAWIEQELIDCICPSLFWPSLPGLPRVREFVDLAGDKDIGIYPTVFPRPSWSEKKPGGGKTMTEISDGEVAGMMTQHRDEICRAALRCYEQGADGVSTFNWVGHRQYSPRIRKNGFPVENYRGSQAYTKTELFVHSFLGSVEHLNRCLQAAPVVEKGECSWQMQV